MVDEFSDEMILGLLAEDEIISAYLQ